MNWRGRLLTSHEVIVELIGAITLSAIGARVGSRYYTPKRAGSEPTMPRIRRANDWVVRRGGVVLVLCAVLAGALVWRRSNTASSPPVRPRPTTATLVGAAVSATPRALAVPPTALQATQTARATPTGTATPVLAATLPPANPATGTATPMPPLTATTTTTPYPPSRTSTAAPATATAQPTRTPTPTPRMCAGAVPACAPRALLPGALLIADSANNRLIEVNAAKKVVWNFPRPGDLRPGQVFLGPDDAFFTSDWRSIITNQEQAQTIGRIDYRTRRLVWQYGHLGLRGSAPGYLNEPDDAYQRRDGVVTVADIRNCRILFLSQAGTIVRQYGRTGVCVHDPPTTFASPNGDTPLADGGMLVTEIGGSHIVRLNARGALVFDLTAPWVAYASDAQLLSDGSVLLADYSSPGGIVRVSATGRLLWRYTPAQAADVLNHPSLAIMLPNGLIAANDDWNHRVVLIDPLRQTIVWQYGVTGVAGAAPGYLDVPDGIDFRPAGT